MKYWNVKKWNDYKEISEHFLLINIDILENIKRNVEREYELYRTEICQTVDYKL